MSFLLVHGSERGGSSGPTRSDLVDGDWVRGTMWS